MTPWRWLNRSRSDHAQRRLRPGRRQQDIRGPGAASESASFRTSLIASILRSWPVGPIVNLADKVRSRLVSEEFGRSEEHTSELQSLMRKSYADFYLKKKK